MNAIELLETQHREVERLFAQFESAKSASEKVESSSCWRGRSWRTTPWSEIFYPACEREMDDEDILGESLVEHGVVEFCLFRADKNRNGDKIDSYVKVLKEVVEHHVEEEEKELLPKVKREIDEERLEALGATMEARFAKALASDFRRPLRDNLQQVLAGRTKTKPKRSASKARATGIGRATKRKQAPARAKSGARHQGR